ncbi:MAG: four helix bundle protein [Rickettsiales bacterium]|jgi:four helix bundle protein|nr:four helix bundle protein [Rickettsiales bacterium]
MEKNILVISYYTLEIGMAESIILIKSEAFADRIIKLYKFLCYEKQEYIISKQIFRSGTSIGANIAESMYAESKKDFISKLAIAQKETAETLYWLRRLQAGQFINTSQYENIYADCTELIKIITSIITSTKLKYVPKSIITNN